MFKIKRFTESDSKPWENFIEKARNTSFLLSRNFMDYHKDRFNDFSLLIFTKEDILCALLPGCKLGSKYISHAGLSYGGLIYTPQMKQNEVLSIMQCVIDYLKQNNFSEFIYKEIPHIYNLIPSDETAYALFRLSANIYRRDVSAVIDLSSTIKWSKGRKALLSIAKQKGYEVNDNIENAKDIIECANYNLEKKYGKKVIHTTEEINLLKSRFPAQIIFMQVANENVFLCGTVLFISQTVIHAQYIANTDQGRREGAFEIIFNHILNKYPDKKYFDFGISTENDGLFLNEGLQSYKESFGARSLLFNHYQLNLC